MVESTASRRRLDIRDLVLIALLAAVGGVLSTYIGYLGNLINRLFGVPFGAGQLIAGLHVIWPLLARGLTGRFGSGTLAGLTKGAVEFLSGGTHGVVILLVSLVEGALVDLGLSVPRRRSLGWSMLVGAIASASNVFVFQAIYFSGLPPVVLLAMVALSLISGAFFGGYLAWDIERILISSGVVRRTAADTTRGRPNWRAHATTLLVVLALLGGAVYYTVNVYDPFARDDAARIEGHVEERGLFVFEEWDGAIRTVHTELRGSVTYVEAMDYTGVSLREVLGLFRPQEGASRVRVIAEDGYEASFDLEEVLARDDILLVLDDGRLRLVVPGSDGATWVRKVTRIVVH